MLTIEDKAIHFFYSSTSMFDKMQFMKSAIDWIAENMNPEEIFSTTQLDRWAESEGYIKATDND
jgi:hypothetical protein